MRAVSPSPSRVLGLLGGAQALSQLGDQLNRLALVGLLWAGAATPSTELLRFVLIASLPALGLGLLAGTIADRFPSRAVLIGSDVARALLVAAIPAVYGAVGMIGVFVVFPFVLGLNRVFRIVRGRLLPEWLPEAALARTNVSLIGVDRSAEVAGAALAGVLVATFGWRTAFWMDAATYVASAALLVGLPAARAHASASTRPPEMVSASWRRTLADARTRPVLSALVLSNAWLAGFAGLLVPRFLDGLPRAHPESATLLAGLLSASLAAGAVTAALTVRRRGPTPSTLVLALVATVPVFALADPARSAVTLLLVTGVAGFLGATLAAGVETALMARVPRAILGRWLSLRDTGERGAFLLGIGVAALWIGSGVSPWPVWTFALGVALLVGRILLVWTRAGTLGPRGLVVALRVLAFGLRKGPVPPVLTAVERIASRTTALHPGASRVLRHNHAPLGSGVVPSRVLGAYGRTHAEVAALAAGRGPWFDARTQVEGLEHLLHADEARAGTIVVTGHIGNWDVLAWTLARHATRPAVFAERLEPASLRGYYEDVRRACGCDTLTGMAGLRSARRRLSAGACVAFLADRSRDGAGVRVSFGTGAVCLPVGPYRLARRTGATVVPAVVFRSGTGYVCRVHAPLEHAPEADMAGAFASILAGWIRAFPEQWTQLSPLTVDGPRESVRGVGRAHTVGAAVGR